MSVLAPSSFTTGLHHRVVSSCTSQPARGTGVSCLCVPEGPGGLTALDHEHSSTGNAHGHPHTQHWAQLVSLSAGTTQTGIRGIRVLRGIHGIQLHLWLLWTFVWMYFSHTHRQTHGQSHTDPPDLLSSPGKTTNKPLISSYCCTVPSFTRILG